MLDVDKSILGAADEDDGAGDLLDHFDRLQFSDVKIGTFFFPHHFFNVFLNRRDDSVNQKVGQKRKVVITQFIDQHFKVCVGIVGDDALNTSILGGVKDGSSCSHATPP